VLIVDDHDGFRESARALLEAEGFAVVGDAADGAAAGARGGCGRMWCCWMCSSRTWTASRSPSVWPPHEPPRVVLISSRDAAAYGPRLDAAPACGFLAKRELSGASLAALVG
jgi:hypothetical protein